MSGRAATTDVQPGDVALSVGLADLPSPDGWAWARLLDLARLESGHTPSRKHPEWWGGDVPWVGIKDAREHDGGEIHETLQHTNAAGLANSSARLLPAGTVCLSRTASVGYVVILGRPMATSQDFVNWVCGPALEPRFLQLLFLAEQRFLHSVSFGSTHRTIYFPVAKAFHVCLPPKEEQRRIVDKIEELFSELDAGVEALERAQKRLERYRASVLQAAVEGRLTERWRAENPPEETGEELLERILLERRKRWEEAYRAKYEAKGKKPPKGWKDRYKEPVGVDTSELPRLPEGWCWASVEQLAFVGTGTTPRKSDARFYEDGDVPWVTSGAVNEDPVVAPSGHVTSYALENTSLTLFPPGTLLMAMYGEGKTRGKVAEMAIEATTNQALAAIQLVGDDHQLQRFIKLSLAAGYEQLRKKSAGGVQPNLNLGIVRGIAVPLPPVREQARIVETVELHWAALHETQSGARKVSRRAGFLRQAILKRAFAGRLVPQDPSDEPASVLLERIQAQRDGSSQQSLDV